MGFRQWHVVSCKDKIDYYNFTYEFLTYWELFNQDSEHSEHSRHSWTMGQKNRTIDGGYSRLCHHDDSRSSKRTPKQQELIRPAQCFVST